ncbi:MAG: type II toxin-antitoxin system RelE/ParE family toxin [Chitinophagales bacterium]|nr:type II toxin-antitoxin system RelE/ParE family toxin [Chitinophagales bacterium]
MNYKIKVSPRAQKEIEDTYDYYSNYSKDVPTKFLTTIRSAYEILQKSPYLKTHYKNIRSLKLNKFPHSLYFTINEEKHIINILACFHNKRNPKNRPQLI